MMRVILIDTIPLYRAGLRAELASVLSGVSFTECETPDEAERALGEAPPASLMVMGLCGTKRPNPAVDDLPALEHMLELAGKAATIVIVPPNDELLRQAVTEAGADRVFPRNAACRDVVAAAAKFLSPGEPHMPMKSGKDIRLPSDIANDGRSGDDLTSVYEAMTPRQREVLRMLALGNSNQEIAYRLGIAVATVKLHVNAVLKRLGVRNRTQAAHAAITRIRSMGAPEERLSLGSLPVRRD